MTKPDDDYAALYKAVCDSYHAIDDFRSKLLGFLPVVSGVGVLALVGNKDVLVESSWVLVFAGVFGALITLGLFLYEVRGMRHCTFLVSQGRELEKRINREQMGQFWYFDRMNPQGPAKGWTDFPGPARVIYTTVFAGWVTIACYPLSRVGTSRVWDALPPLIGGATFGAALLFAYVRTKEAVEPPAQASPGVFQT